MRIKAMEYDYRRELRAAPTAVEEPQFPKSGEPIVFGQDRSTSRLGGFAFERVVSCPRTHPPHESRGMFVAGPPDNRDHA